MSKKELITIAEETVSILKEQGYAIGDSYTDISETLDYCISKTRTYNENNLLNLKIQN